MTVESQGLKQKHLLHARKNAKTKIANQFVTLHFSSHKKRAETLNEKHS
jgi:hypothetical protein